MLWHKQKGCHVCLPAVMGELTAFRAKLLDCQKHIKVWALATAPR